VELKDSDRGTSGMRLNIRPPFLPGKQKRLNRSPAKEAQNNRFRARVSRKKEKKTGGRIREQPSLKIPATRQTEPAGRIPVPFVVELGVEQTVEHLARLPRWVGGPLSCASLCSLLFGSSPTAPPSAFSQWQRRWWEARRAAEAEAGRPKLLRAVASKHQKEGRKREERERERWWTGGGGGLVEWGKMAGWR
jgi:hypothetical protein